MELYRGFKSRHRQPNITCAKVPGIQVKTSATQHHMCKGTGVSSQDIGNPTSHVQRYRGFKSRHRQPNITCAKVPGIQVKTSATQHHMCKGTGDPSQDIGNPTSHVQRYRGSKSRHRQPNITCAKVPGIQVKTSATLPQITLLKSMCKPLPCLLWCALACNNVTPCTS